MSLKQVDFCLMLCLRTIARSLSAILRIDSTKNGQSRTILVFMVAIISSCTLRLQRRLIKLCLFYDRNYPGCDGRNSAKMETW